MNFNWHHLQFGNQNLFLNNPYPGFFSFYFSSYLDLYVFFYENVCTHDSSFSVGHHSCRSVHCERDFD